jgi:putative endonuclease
MGNWTGEVLYIGVTASLKRRVFEHKAKLVEGFTCKYNVDRLLYYETFSDIRDAIAREKQLKAGPRKKKVNLINAFNPNWNDLYNQL